VRTLYLVRHGVAQDQSSWAHPDELRPLTDFGWRQAVAIGELLAQVGVGRFISSPTIRCLDTLLPTAHRVGLGVAEDQALFETNEPRDHNASLELLKGLAATCLGGEVERAAACTHGNVLLPLLAALGASNPGRCPKGGVWKLEFHPGKTRVEEVEYLGRLHPESGNWTSR